MTRSEPAAVTDAIDAAPKAMFEPTTRGFSPTAATLGPWGPSTLHGGPVAGLLAHGLLGARDDDPDIRLARLTVDMPRAVLAAELELSSRIVRSGRRVLVVDAELRGGDQLVARATGLLLRSSAEPDGGLRQQEPAISPLDEALDAGLPLHPLHHANCIELRRARHGAYWVRVPLPLVEGVALDPAG